MSYDTYTHVVVYILDTKQVVDTVVMEKMRPYLSLTCPKLAKYTHAWYTCGLEHTSYCRNKAPDTVGGERTL